MRFIHVATSRVRSAAALLLVSLLAGCSGGGDSGTGPSLTVQTISFTGPGNQRFGIAPPLLSAGASSGLAVTIASETTTVCTVSGTTLTLVAPGTCTLVASQAGNASFQPAASVTVTVVVSPGEQLITFPSPGNQTLGTAPPALVATSSAGLPVSIASTTAAVCTVTGSTLTLVAAGSCSLNASQAGNANYAAAPTVTVSFAVASCVPAPAGAGSLLNFDVPSLSYTVTGFNGAAGAVAVDPIDSCNRVGAVTRTPASQFDGATFGTLPPATNPIIATVPFTAITNTLTLRVLVPTANTLVHLKVENALNPALNYETEVIATQANVWQTLTFPLDAPLVGGLPGQQFNPTTTYNRVSVFFGFGGVQGASPATYYFDDLTLDNGTAGPGQSITFATPGTQTIGRIPAPLVASASSGLPVVISSQTAGVCTVSGTTLTLVAAGTCTLTASQSGNATFDAATPVTVSFTVAPQGISSALIDFDNAALTYTVFGFNGDTGSVVTDPTDATNRVGSVARRPDVQFDGATFGDMPPADNPTIAAIPFTAATNALSLRVYVPEANTLVHLKIENAANGAINYETEVLATQANSWQTLVFPLNAPLVGGLPGQPFNLANSYNRVSVFFDFGRVNGSTQTVWLFDDLILLPL